MFFLLAALSGLDKLSVDIQSYYLTEILTEKYDTIICARKDIQSILQEYYAKLLGHIICY